MLFLPWAVMNLQCFTLRLPLKLSLLSGDSFKYYFFLSAFGVATAEGITFSGCDMVY